MMTTPARPRVTLKLATSLDGRIATASGESRWITGPEARAVVHHQRAQHDAVLVGIGTVLADDPKLTARTDPPAPRQPLRVVLDTQARTPARAAIVRSACRNAPVRIYVGEAAQTAMAAPAGEGLEREGLKIVASALAGGRLDVAAVCADLAGQSIASLYVEGGGLVAASFLAADCVDRIEWFRAGLVLGGDGRPAIGPLGLSALADARRWRRVGVREVGPDLWERYERDEG
jgi:diaminohydroxyphosphoribosylaminopyrimidine deaminase/5-amino-6-(5-phosphoribosylamino)uracil reductase